LPGGGGVAPGAVCDEPPANGEEHLRRRYGALASEVAAVAREDPSLATRLVHDLPELRAEVAWAVDHEMAMTLDDVMSRRLHLRLRTRAPGAATARSVAELMAARLGWDGARVDAEVRCYEEGLARARAVLEAAANIR
jgi:glycerol-3-phosphate dehydrogenase